MRSSAHSVSLTNVCIPVRIHANTSLYKPETKKSTHTYSVYWTSGSFCTDRERANCSTARTVYSHLPEAKQAVVVTIHTYIRVRGYIHTHTHTSASTHTSTMCNNSKQKYHAFKIPPIYPYFFPVLRLRCATVWCFYSVIGSLSLYLSRNRIGRSVAFGLWISSWSGPKNMLLIQLM